MSQQNILSRKVQEIRQHLVYDRLVKKHVIRNACNPRNPFLQRPAGVNQRLEGVRYFPATHLHGADFYDFVCFRV